MNLDLKGIHTTSLIDWPGKISSVVFLAKCNFRCPFCHNPDLIEGYQKIPNIKIDNLFEILESKRKWIDGVCITGGEPTLYSDLPEFIAEIKERDFEVKLDTNGTNPEMIYDLIKKRLIDYIAMDIKNIPSKYAEVTASQVLVYKIKKSVEIIKKGEIDYEFRTTVVPDLHSKEDIKKIGQWLKGSKRYFIQQFRPLNTLDPKFLKKRSFLASELKELKKEVEGYFKNCEIRGV